MHRPMSEATRKILRDSAPSQRGRSYATQLPAPTQVTIGKFRFTFRPDGDDSGVGSVLMETVGYRVATPFGVTRWEWDEFAEAFGGR